MKSNDGMYAIVKGDGIGCNMEGEWKKIAPVYTASELGFVPNSLKAKESNYAKLQSVIKRGLNVYLDGKYYIYFQKPLLLNYEVHLYGGELLFSQHAFDLTDGGGVYANGVHFSSIAGSKTDDIVCGTREKHHPITTGPITFINCHFSCNRVLSLEFEYANPLKKIFGIKSLLVRNCFADHTAKFIALDVPFLNQCTFRNNVFTNFSHAPIYLAHNHSVRTHPNEANTNPWTEEIIDAGCDVIINSNVFIGKEVQDPSYYCAALVIAQKCFFLNNYLKDIVNYSDRNAKGYTAYDAYLSCVEVDYENNYVENMMSYAKDGAQKPQNEIGKSKMNPLEPFGVKAMRKYINNIFICDGSTFLSKGADKSSMMTSIFCNVSPIDTYLWQNNSVIYPNIILDGRHSSAKYGRFDLINNYFECQEFTGVLLFSNSAYDLAKVEMRRNCFKAGQNSSITLFNQLYESKYKNYTHGDISIIENSFVNTTPITHYFVANKVRVKNNEVENASLEKNTYLSNYSGAKTPLAVNTMEAEIVVDSRGQSKGAAHQFFSSSSTGEFFIDMHDVPKMGIYYTYQVDSDHTFQIVWNQGKETHTLDFYVSKGRVSYSFDEAQKVNVRFGQTEPVVFSSKGLTVKSKFEKGSPNRIVTSLTGHSDTAVRFGYIGK